MPQNRWSRIALVALVALTAGCAAKTAPPPATAATAKPAVEPVVAPAVDLSPNKLHDRRAEAGVRAAAKPLVIGKDSAAKCGKIGKGEKEGEASELLSGRLKLRAPAGAKAPPATPEQAPAEEESRLVVDAPEKAKEHDKLALAIMAKETFQLDPDMYEAEQEGTAKVGTLDVEAPKYLKATLKSAMPDGQQLEITPVEIGEAKLRAYAARPKDPNAAPGKDTALVLGLLIAMEDGTLESVSFHVRGEAVRNATGSELVGCTRLAERIASTIAAGPRKLERAAGRRHVADVAPDRELVVSVPADYIVVPTAGTSGAKVTKLRPLSLYAGSIAVALADKQAAAVEGGETAKGKMFGRPTEWKGQSTPKGGFVLFTAEPVDESKSKIAEVLVKATHKAKALDEMRGIAETLAVVKRAH